MASLTGLLFCLHASVATANPPVPVAAYSFDEGSGATVKDSAGSNDGTIDGATWTAGKYGSALEFDGVDDLVSVADAAELDLTDSFTVEAWVRPQTLSAARPAVSKMESAGGISGYALTAKHFTGPSGVVAKSGAVKAANGPAALPAEAWSHLAFTSDGSSLWLYLNGELLATAGAIGAKGTAAPLEIGHNPTLGHFDGLIDEVRLYAEPLSKDQIQVDRDTAVGLDQIPVAAYSFDEGSGSTLGDSIGDHHGTISGATWTAGKFGSALNFDGVDDLVSIADSSRLDVTDSFTLEAWVRPDTAVDWTPAISKVDNSGNGESGYVLFSRGPGKPRGYVANAGATQRVTGVTALPLETWSHLVLTSDGANLRLYVDGSLVATQGAIASNATSGSLEIGHWDSLLDIYFSGQIDEVRIYDETLSHGQIETDKATRIEPPALREVVTAERATGTSAELVASLPITSGGTEAVVYSLAVPSVSTDEILRATANLEVINKHAYAVADSIRLVLGSNPSDTNGTGITPWTTITHTSDMYQWTLPINGVYRAPSNLGDQYLKVVLKAASQIAHGGDALTIQANSGGLAVTRLIPAAGPMSQPTHEMQPQIDPLPQLVNSIPANSSWQRVMTRRVSGLSHNDLLEIFSQVDIQHSANATVQLESKITRTATPATGGSWASDLMIDRLSPHTPSARISHAAHLLVDDPGRPYLNLAIRAVPISGTPTPLSVAVGTVRLDVLRHRPDPGDPSAPLRTGTRVSHSADFSANIESLPYEEDNSPEPRVVASAPLYDGFWKGEVIRASGRVTADLDGAATNGRLAATIIVADSPTSISGEVIGPFGGDKIPSATQVHTVIAERSFALPRAEPETKYINLVASASRNQPSEVAAMKVPAAQMHVMRSKSTAPLNEDFEGGQDTDGLDSLFEYEYNGTLSASSEVAREGVRSLLVDLDLINQHPDTVLRNEVRPPDIRSAAGHYGEDTWHGFSAYFPEDFKVPRPDSIIYFDGLIDEVRLYDQALSETAIAADRDGNYAQSPAPVAAYGFSESFGSTAVDSTGNHDGAIQGATRTASGKYGPALAFDGIDDSVAIPDSAALDLTGSFTLEAWVRPESLDAWTGTPVISKLDDPNGNKSGYILRAAASGVKPSGLVANAGAVAIAHGMGDGLTPDKWSHLALTSNGTELRLYVDGVLVRSVSTVGASETVSQLMIGSSNYNTATSGTFNIFSQWHLLKDENPLFGCAASLGGWSPAIAFGVNYYKSGSHTNPGASSTATPASGDYISVSFNGGEINASCEPVNGTAKYVLAPLERERWYDFILHTHWTHLGDSPEGSVSEVWIDGKQVLGDASTPVFRPTLLWRDSPALHNKSAYWQFGLYRGRSLDNPQSRHYMDAVRTGESYSEVAPRP